MKVRIVLKMMINHLWQNLLIFRTWMNSLRRVKQLNKGMKHSGNILKNKLKKYNILNI
jgi:hypothetical protein